MSASLIGSLQAVSLAVRRPGAVGIQGQELQLSAGALDDRAVLFQLEFCCSILCAAAVNLQEHELAVPLVMLSMQDHWRLLARNPHCPALAKSRSSPRLLAPCLQLSIEREP